MPISKVGATLTLAMADPTNVFAMDDIKFMTGLNVEPVIASETSLQVSISKYYSASTDIDIFDESEVNEYEKISAKLSKGKISNGNGSNGNDTNVNESATQPATKKISDSELNVSLDRFQFDTPEAGELEVVDDNDEIDLAELAKASEDAPVVRLVNVLLVDSLRRGASDIHIEPYEKDFRIRFRIDGVLYDIMHPPLKNARRAYFAFENHGEAGYFRETPAAGWTHQDQSKG